MTSIEPKLAPTNSERMAYEGGRIDASRDIVTELERMLSVCEYPEVRAFIPLLVERIKEGIR